MSRFAADGWPVVYVDTVGLRSPRFRDLPRIISRLRRRFRVSTDGIVEPPPGLRVVSPLQLPFLDSRIARRLNAIGLEALVRRHLRTEEGGLVIWVYLPTWTVLQCVKALPHCLLVYEVIDALAGNPVGVSRDFHASESEILRRADVVITSSESLYREKVIHNPNTHWVASGVAESFFEEHSPSEEVQTIPGPRIGFFGTLDHRLNQDLMVDLAVCQPDWSFVLIGPARCDISRLTRIPNIHWLGHREHVEVPVYLVALDVVFLPYMLDGFTRHIYPAKIHECLAMGVPVVATALPALEPFAGIVHLVHDERRFAGEIEAALSQDNPQMRQRRIELARANSWEVKYGEIRTLVKEAMIRKVSEG